MLIDLEWIIKLEKDILINDLVTHKGFELKDHTLFLGIKTPFEVTNSNNEFRYYIGVGSGVEVLSYWDEHCQRSIPWISFEFPIRDDISEEKRLEILKWLRDVLDNSEGFKPFKDEDGQFDYFTKGYHIDNFKEYRYQFFMNADYPKGWWSNHTIDCMHL